MNKLKDYGLTDKIETEYIENTEANGSSRGTEEVIGRIIKDFGRSWLVITENGELKAEISGKLRHEGGRPAIGDWLALRQVETDKAVVTSILSRKSKISRNSAGNETTEQIMAANVDLVFIVFGLEGGRQFSQGAVERYVTLGWNSEAIPCLILNKMDLAAPDNIVSAMNMAEEAAPGVNLILTSCETMEGIDQVKGMFSPGKTCVVIGPSGVGKSSIINALVGDEKMKTGDIREKEKKGSHTTTHRELILLPEGGCMIDTPGLRELQLWADDEALGKTFSDIEEIASECRFNDCSHQGEPGCAVQAALAEGLLTHRRYENYLDLQRELAYLNRKTDFQARKEETDKWKQIHKTMKDFYSKNGGKRTG
ncbi:MAG: ribosome small subunit-dependent GTPase A [Spirochaetales bacterium]|nr:ribosome small subunit-dependent GTPase A [Spirochaetales bacterium]